MAVDAKKVSILLGWLAKGADSYAEMTATGADHVAARAASGILNAVMDLLEKRSTEEVQKLLMDLVAHPAAKIDLDATRRTVAETIAKRRREDERD
jgi:hypothetical protein